MSKPPTAWRKRTRCLERNLKYINIYVALLNKYMYSVIFSTIYIQILNELGISLTLNINFNNVSHAVVKQV